MTMAATTRALAGTLLLLLLACSAQDPHSAHTADHEPDEAAATGPHGGRLLTSGDFELELAIFQRGVPPELRAWVREDGQLVAPADVSLRVELARLGGRVDEISFAPEAGYLRGDRIVSEPHSFEVKVEAQHGGETHTWRYESFEGRTRIAPELAASLGIETAVAGPVVLRDTVTVYGRIRANPERVREVRARFEGVVRGVHADVGDMVATGDRLLTIESNESLEAYSIRAPIGGVVTQRDANPGEQTSGRLLLTITDPSSVWADLAVFPQDRSRVGTGNSVSIAPAIGGKALKGVISTVEVLARDDQSVTARAVLPNPEGRLVPGTFVTAEITFGEHEVPLAVRREGLQSFRDFKVVYAQVDDQYEVRMLELGREGREYVAVLSGIEPGTRYVSANSYVIKADIEKSGAAHDH
ncbi:MAG: efflux RND transporter periplasmic adaptor subunit [Myxococcota bacterium]